MSLGGLSLGRHKRRGFCVYLDCGAAWEGMPGVAAPSLGPLFTSSILYLYKKRRRPSGLETGSFMVEVGIFIWRFGRH